MHQFKFGDKIRMLKDCSSCKQGETYTLGKIGANPELFAVNPKTGDGCSCQDSWQLVSAKSGELPRFLLRYELDTDPVEEFAALPEVKARIKELLSNRSLKRDSIKVYELRSVLDVQIQDLIVMKRVTIKSPAPAKKKGKSKTSTK